MPLATQLPGESDLQYYLRQGLNPNDASSALSGSMTGNGSPVQSAASRLNSFVLGRNNPNQRDFYGRNVAAKEYGGIGDPLINLPNAGPALDASFYGGYGQDSISSASRGNISNNSGVAPTQADYGYQKPSPYVGQFASQGGMQTSTGNPRGTPSSSPVAAMEQQRQAAWAAYYSKQGQPQSGGYRLNPGQLKTNATEQPVSTPKFSSIVNGGQQLTSSGGPDYGNGGFLKNNWQNPQWGNQ